MDKVLQQYILNPLENLPNNLGRNQKLAHAPNRIHNLSNDEIELALTNALRYFPKKYHLILKPEFLEELKAYGHIYMYRFNQIFLKANPMISTQVKLLKLKQFN